MAEAGSEAHASRRTSVGVVANLASLAEERRRLQAEKAEAERIAAENDYNFSYWNKRLKFSERSLGCLTPQNKLRRFCVWLTQSPYFENFVLFLILANSIILGLVDYNELTPTGELDDSTSMRNRIVNQSELVFTILFTIEMTLKVIAMGFVTAEGTYLRDAWNGLDFVVVIAGLLSLIPNIPNVSAIRTLRVLRPLRSLHSLPGMKLLVISLLRSIPALLNVVALLCFVFAIFGILGVQLWAGDQHARCRFTDYPVRFTAAAQATYNFTGLGPCESPLSEACTSLVTNWTALELDDDYVVAPSASNEGSNGTAMALAYSNFVNGGLMERCLPGAPLNDPEWGKSKSPWRIAQDCFWPVDPEDERICTLGGGHHHCARYRWCGSNYDEFGNERFTNDIVMRAATFIPGLNFGYTRFDSIASGFLSIFQSITMEGWVDIMYQVMDGFNAIAAALYFIFLIFFGSFFLLNLTLAVIWENFNKGQEEEEEEARAREAEEDEQLRQLGVERVEEAGFDSSSSSGEEELVEESPHSYRGSPSSGHAPYSSASQVSGSKSHGSAEGDGIAAGVARHPSRRRGMTPASHQGSQEGDEVRDEAMAAALPPKLPGRVMRPAPGSGGGFSQEAGGHGGQASSSSAEGGRSRAESSGSAHSAVPRGLALPPPGELPRSTRSEGRRRSHDHRHRHHGHHGHHGGSHGHRRVRSADRHHRRVSQGSAGLSRHRGLGSAGGWRRRSSATHGSGFIAGAHALNQPPEMSFTEGYRTEQQAKALEQAKRRSRLFHPLRKFCFDLVTSTWFKLGIMAVIVINTCVLAADHYPMKESATLRLETTNFILTLLFVVEMILKLIGLGFREYARDSFNLFDGVIVIASLIEVILTPPGVLTGGPASDGAGAISALRTFRLFRVFALAKSWRGLRVLLNTIIATLRDVANFAVLLLLFMYIFALVGMQFFANTFCFDPTTHMRVDTPDNHCPEGMERPRANFDNLLWAFVTIFQILTGENWNTVMYDGMRATNGTAVIYFIILVIVMVFIVLNLFLAILLGNFDDMEEQLRLDEERNKLDEIPLHTIKKIFSWKERAKESARRLDRQSGASLAKQRTANLSARFAASGRTPAAMSSRATVGVAGQSRSSDVMSARSSRSIKRTVTLHGKALMLLPPESGCRNSVSAFVQHPWFDNVILVAIALSSILLAVDSPFRDPESGFSKFLFVIDLVITGLFTVEMVLKIITFGFVMHKNSYLRNGWNVLDFVIVIVSLISLGATNSTGLRSLRSLRTLRALRPLRVISRRPGLKLIVNALFSSLFAITNVLFVCILFFMIFGVLGVSYFKGAFDSCQGDAFESASEPVQGLIIDPVPWADMSESLQAQFSPSAAAAYEASYNVTQAPTSKFVCQQLGFTWDKALDSNFDNIWDAMSTLLQMATTEGWTDVMIQGVDARGMEMQPQRDAQVGWVFFFLGFMIVGSFFILNLFVGVVVDNFNRMKNEMGEDPFITPEQREWVKTQEIMLVMRPWRRAKRPEGCRSWFFDLVRWEWFDPIIMCCIIGNTAIMAMNYFGQSDTYGLVLSALNYLFAIIFTVEAIFKLVAYGWKHYVDDNWNRFDLAIVIGTNVGIALQLGVGLDIGGVATIVRTFRIGRIFRLIKQAKSLNQLFNTLVITLPSLGNIGSLLMLLFFIYAIMGVQLFATVQLGESLNDVANFQTFWVAILTLMRFSTGEAWNYVMYDAARQTDGCRNLAAIPYEDKKHLCGFSKSPDCEPLDGCGSPAAFLFFFTFTLFITFITLNLFIAVILEQFVTTGEEEEMRLSRDMMEKFTESWMEFDPDATCYISAEQLLGLMQRLPEPMGFHTTPAPTEMELREHILALNIPLYEGKRVHFQDVSTAIARKVFYETSEDFQEPSVEDIAGLRKIQRQQQRAFAGKDEATEFDFGTYVVYRVIERAVAKWKFRRNINNRVEDNPASGEPLSSARAAAGEDDEDAADAAPPGALASDLMYRRAGGAPGPMETPEPRFRHPGGPASQRGVGLSTPASVMTGELGNTGSNLMTPEMPGARLPTGNSLRGHRRGSSEESHRSPAAHSRAGSRVSGGEQLG